MKKVFILFIGFMVIATSAFATVTTLSYVSPSDVTITRMESNRQTLTDAANSVDGALIQAGTVTVTALTDNARTDKRWDDAFSDWVFTGLVVPTTSGTLTATTTSGRAYITGTRVEKDATAHLYTASKWTFVDLSSEGVYTYSEESIGAADPAITADSLRLSRVSSDPTQIFAVRDDRVTAVTLGSEQENFQRENYTISVVTPATVTVSPGIVYHGTTRINKTTDTSLALGTAADFVTSGGSRANSTKGYVVVNSGGTQYKLTTTAPTKTDTSGNSAGELRYSVIDSAYWRVLDWFWMDAVGAGNLTEESYGSWQDNVLPGAAVQTVSNFTAAVITDANQNISLDDNIPQITEGTEALTVSITAITGNTIVIEAMLNVSGSGGGGDVICPLFIDSTAAALDVGILRVVSADKIDTLSFIYTTTAADDDEHVYRVRIGSAGVNVGLNGTSGGTRFFGGVGKSWIRATEYKE